MFKREFKFVEGDLVCHRSNLSFTMVVNYVDVLDQNDGMYECTWLDAEGRCHSKDFEEFELEKTVSL